MRIKSYLHIFVSFICVTALFVLAVPNADAVELANAGSSCVVRTAVITMEQEKTINKITDVGEYFELSDTGGLSITLTDEQLAGEFGFTKDEINFLHSSVLFDTPQAKRIKKSTLAKSKCAGGLYISYQDFIAGFGAALFAASSISPQALAASFTAISSIVGGPVASVISAGIAVLGAGFFADLAMKIAGAVVQKKGVCIQTQWGFPQRKAAIQ